MSSNAKGDESAKPSIDWAAVDSGMSEDVENALTRQGVSDREMLPDANLTEAERIVAAGLADKRIPGKKPIIDEDGDGVPD